MRVVGIIKLRAADKGDVPLNEALMEGSVGVGGAVGGDEQVCRVKEGGVCGDELYLHGPLGQAALRGGSVFCGGGGRKRFYAGSGAEGVPGYGV